MMRTAILSLAAAAGLLAADPTAPGPQIPRKAPELAIHANGRDMQLSQFQGYIRALAFMSTTCPHCQHMANVMAALQQEYSSKGVQMLGVCINPEASTPGELDTFIRNYARGMFPVGLSNEAIVRPFLQHPSGMMYFPDIVFIDKHGVIRSQHLGATDAQFFDEKIEAQNIRGELDKIIAEPTVQVGAPAKGSVKK